MISQYISYKEAIYSATAIKKGIFNDPNEDQLRSMHYIGKELFDRVRIHFGVPIKVSSFFRSHELNKLIGGALSSQHLTGEAIDIDADYFGGVTNAEIFHFIKDHLQFDQLIWEYGDNNNPNWVHVSLKEHSNRREVLKCIKGRYELWE